MNTSENLDAIERAKRVRLVVFDVDGVMTDGSLYLCDDGQEYKAFNSQDGLGMKLLKASGVDMAIITGRTSNVVVKRAENTGVAHFFQGVEDKLEAFEQLARELGLDHAECAFMGDDVVDLPPMRRCGFAITVPAAPGLVKAHAHYVTSREGGRGAVRDVVEFIMRAQGTFDAQMAQYLK
ncbi:MAG TPA: HAD-IIIA family hydrolase [Methylophilaceae bacterium]|nr:HAD-IIIA family hydrolase [Methylophilaceae bacterium]HQR61218.1 HAD-IIIA family hydrolase [Methylophilaceae bacterium]